MYRDHKILKLGDDEAYDLSSDYLPFWSGKINYGRICCRNLS
jgi:hypothetical protein